MGEIYNTRLCNYEVHLFWEDRGDNLEKNHIQGVEETEQKWKRNIWKARQ